MKRAGLLAVLAAAVPTYADVYRCVGSDGSMTFSQTPCSQAAERVSLIAGKSTGTIAADCRVAEHFSHAVSTLMRQGFTKAESLAEFGGSEAIGPGTQRLVDYVYMYKDTRGMSHDRVVALATAQCETGSLGDVSCQALPRSYTESGGGCDGEFSAQAAAPQVDVFARNRAASEARAREASEIQSAQIEQLKQDYAKRERVRQCQQRIQGEISQHEISIHAGADPNGHRLALQRLRADMKKCQ